MNNVAARSRFIHSFSLPEPPSTAVETFFNFLIYIAAGVLGCDADCILDRIRVRSAMADDANAFHAEQRSAAEFGIIDALLELRESRTGQQVSDLPGDGRLQRLLQHVLDHFDDALAHLQRDIADEAVAYDDVGMAGIKIAPFDVADEIQRKRLQQRRGRIG